MSIIPHLEFAKRQATSDAPAAEETSDAVVVPSATGETGAGTTAVDPPAVTTSEEPGECGFFWL
jgi:hypothetical protein